MRDESRTWRKPQMRLNITAVRERIQAAAERMETGGAKVQGSINGYKGDLLGVCCSALETALLLHAFDRESSQDIVAEALVLLRAERACRERGE